MNCSVCGKSYATYDETKACYESHQTSPEEIEAETPTLNALYNLYRQRSEPVKRIGPKSVALEGDETPKAWVTHLIGVAKDGNGKLTLPQIRWELQDKSITMSDVLGWFALYAADVKAVPHPGNTLYITAPQARRQVKRIGPTGANLAVIGEKQV